jgi:2-hydroxy-3-oxopropionate reductase
MTMQAIGFIGLGIMGIPMAKNLLAKGFPLHVYARKPDTCTPLVAAGAQLHDSPEKLAQAADVIITIVNTTHDVEEILFGKHGVVAGAKAGTIIIDMSTIAAGATQRIAQQLATHQLDMLDAPVSGGEQGAIAGTLSIMVGGKTSVLETVRPILAALGKLIVHIGEQNGAGQTAKACNQIIIAETIVAVSEALQLAKTAGVDPAKVREALLGGFAASRVLEVHGKRMLDNDYRPGFKAGLHRKDMHLALDQAHAEHLKLPAATYAMQCLDRLVMKGHGEKDSAAIYLITEDH